MLNDHLDYRALNLKRIQQINFDQKKIDYHNKRGFYHTTKNGTPIFIERLGKSDYKKLLTDFTMDQMFEYYI